MILTAQCLWKRVPVYAVLSLCVCVCVCGVCVCVYRHYKRCMEYLFYVPDPEHTCESDETLPILENGFKTADAYKVQNPSKPGEDWLCVSVVLNEPIILYMDVCFLPVGIRQRESHPPL